LFRLALCFSQSQPLLSTTASFAARVFASQAGIINFDPAAQDPAFFSLAHDLEQLMAEF
jgi:hypothetical protein